MGTQFSHPPPDPYQNTYVKFNTFEPPQVETRDDFDEEYTQYFEPETIRAEGDSNQLNEVVDYYKRALSGALPTE